MPNLLDVPRYYSPVRHVTQLFLAKGLDTFDLHVLGTPPAFILSQDQTLSETLQHTVCAKSFDSVVARTSTCWQRRMNINLANLIFYKRSYQRFQTQIY